MDIVLSFLAKPLNKHGITLVNITYQPLGFRPSIKLNDELGSIQKLILKDTWKERKGKRTESGSMCSAPF